MAEGKKEAKAPFGASPVTLVIGGIGLVAIVVLLLFPGSPDQGRPAGGTKPAAGNAPPPPAAVVTTEPLSTGRAGPADPLTSFLVRFGRKNPFASTRGMAAQNKAGQSGASRQTGQSGTSLDDLRQRLQNLQGQDAGGAVRPQGQEGFVLTGIVRLETLALAVIVQGQRSHIVGAGDRLEKTAYSVKAIEEDRVVLASEDKELVLVLRGKKP